MRYVLLVLAAMTLLAFSAKDKKYADLKKKVTDQLAKEKIPADSIHFINIQALTAQEFILQASERYTYLIKDDSFDLETYNMLLNFNLTVIRTEKEGSREYKKTAERIAENNSKIELTEIKIAAHKISRDSCIASAKTADNHKIIGHVCLVFVKWRSKDKDPIELTVKYLFLDGRLLNSWTHSGSFLDKHN